MAAEPITHVECAHCGVLTDLTDRETIAVFLSDWTAFIYHPWCWPEAAKRIVPISSQRVDDLTPIDLLDLGLMKPDDK